MAMPPDDPPPGVPEWVVTYGDMMSLLLTFFIMLVSMSQMKSDSGSVRAMMDSIKEQFGPEDGRAGSPGTSPQHTSLYDKMSSTGSASEGGTKEASRDSEGTAGAHVTVERIRDGSVVTFGGPAVFGSLEAEVGETLEKHLDILIGVLEDRPNHVVVRGHASPEERPEDVSKAGEQTGFEDQYDLSYARASNVAEYLVSKGISRDRILVSAVAATEPRVVTRDDELRARNRRVDVFVIDSYTAPAQPADSAGT